MRPSKIEKIAPPRSSARTGKLIYAAKWNINNFIFVFSPPRGFSTFSRRFVDDTRT